MEWRFRCAGARALLDWDSAANSVGQRAGSTLLDDDSMQSGAASMAGVLDLWSCCRLKALVHTCSDVLRGLRGAAGAD